MKTSQIAVLVGLILMAPHVDKKIAGYFTVIFYTISLYFSWKGE